MEKKFYQSKTVWFNVVTTILLILSLADIQNFISPKWIALLNGIGNIILRVWFTSSSITK